MALSFLCSVHRDWVHFHPQTALTYLEDSQNQGELLIQAKNWKDAISFLGCAFEATEILIELQGIEKTFLLGRLTTLAMMLADSFEEQKALGYKAMILLQAEQKLKMAAEVSLGNKARLALIQKCIFSIRVHKEQNSIGNEESYLQISADVH